MAGEDRARGEEPLLLLLLLVLVALAVVTLSKLMADDLLRLSALAAWLHVWPVAEGAGIAEWSAGLPAIGTHLVQPAVAAEGLLRRAWSGDIGRLDWSVGQAAAGKIAVAVYGPVLLLLVWRARSNRPDLAFRRTHSLESLLAAQSAIWSASRVVRHFEDIEGRHNPEEMIAEARRRTREIEGPDPAAGSLAVRPATPIVAPPSLEIALRPETWLRAEGMARNDPEGLSSDSGDPADLTVELSNEWEHLTADAVSEVMELRLGQPWTGFSGLRPVHRGLAAAFACFLFHREREGRGLLTALAVLADGAMARDRPLDAELLGNRPIARQVEDALYGEPGRELLRIADRHAWQRTAMMGMLQAARKDRGVISTASFIWLKREDRCLWHALNAAGNAVAVAEAAAVCSHYRAERQAGLPLRRPSAFQASRSLVRDYLDLENPRIPRRRVAAGKRSPVGRKLAEAAAGSRFGADGADGA